MRFFKTLSGFFETTAKQNQAGGQDAKNTSIQFDPKNDVNAQRREVIDEHLFVEALALTAFEIVY